jgi:hypothetical protein
LGFLATLEGDVIRGIAAFTAIALLSVWEASASQAPCVPEGHQSDEEAAVLEAMDRYLTAISGSDLEAQTAMQAPGGMTYQWRPAEGGGMHITAHPNTYWTDPSRDGEHAYRERYWSPTVMIRGGIAVVWAPYEFWIDGRTSHCGVDVVDFVRIDGKWLVSNAMWTVEPEACSELRPVDPTKVWPED